MLAALGFIGVIVFNSCTRSDHSSNNQPNFNTYRFEDSVSLPATSVKVQGMSGTCWSFVGTSFLESELLRTTGEQYDLSEMFVVRNAYFEKARNYILRQGTARFTEGGLIHDVLISAARYGIATEAYYSGLPSGKTLHDHRKLFPALKDVVTSHGDPAHHLGGDWKDKIKNILDQYMGKLPLASGGRNSPVPQEFLKGSGLNMDDYVTVTSFSHAPFHAPFVLEIPANFASERFYNLPIDEFITNLDWALDHGFTLALDGDFTEPYFGNGVAVLPVGGTTPQQVSSGRFEEERPTQDLRQSAFESFHTTDDHLMHLVGKATDQFGRRYYKAKNCWGVKWGRAGYAYLSEAYLKMKAISVTLHREGLAPSTRTSLKLKTSDVASLSSL